MRLTLARALLRGRREADAHAEAEAAARVHAHSAAAQLWRGRCLLRRGQRDNGFGALARAVELGAAAGAGAR